ncbi:MAG: HEAT repeat domain-containing protein [Cellulomonas sp.]
MTTRRAHHASALRDLGDDAVVAYLDAHSGLPGPRADLELVQAFAQVCGTAAPALVDGLLADPDEFRRMCATVALAPRLLAATTAGDRSRVVVALRDRASDGSWRVREGVATAWQLVGDADPELLRSTMAGWAADGPALVRRAAVAALCEPRLLHDAATTGAALTACATATTFLASRSADERPTPEVRTLRQALGYCWSVAVAADPERGVAAFLPLTGSSDPDVAWVVRENRKKKRMPALPVTAT